MSLQRIESAAVKDQRVLMQIDLASCTDTSGHLIHDIPLQQSLDTLELLLSRGASVILLAHAGSQTQVPSLKMAADRLSELLGQSVECIPDPLASESQTRLANMASGQIVLLDNLLQYAEEASGQSALAQRLSQLGQLYVNEAAGTGHKKYASIVELPAFMPAFIGIGHNRAFEILNSMDSMDHRPLMLVLGGVNLQARIELVQRYLEKVRILMIGGGLAYTFMKGRALPIGTSLVDKELEVPAFQCIEKAELAEAEIQLPIDHLIADQFSRKASTKIVKQAGILDGWQGMDIGPKTLSLFEKHIKRAGSILWHGPLGCLELDFGRRASLSFAKSLAKAKGRRIIMGQDTVRLVHSTGLSDKFDLLMPGSEAGQAIIHQGINPALRALQNSRSMS